MQKVGDIVEYNGIRSAVMRTQADINALKNMSERAHSISRILDSVAEDLSRTLEEVKKVNEED